MSAFGKGETGHGCRPKLLRQFRPIIRHGDTRTQNLESHRWNFFPLAAHCDGPSSCHFGSSCEQVKWQAMPESTNFSLKANLMPRLGRRIMQLHAN